MVGDAEDCEAVLLVHSSRDAVQFDVVLSPPAGNRAVRTAFRKAVLQRLHVSKFVSAVFLTAPLHSMQKNVILNYV